MRLLTIIVVLFSTVVGNSAESDLLIADFEGDSYGEWTVTGEAFGSKPARGALAGQMHVEGFEGKGLVNSFLKGDTSTGTLTSPEFTIQRKFICFLIGGGRHEGKTCINLLVEGKELRTTTGPNNTPGGTERLDWEAWDVREFAGKKAQIQIVDNATGGWGHVNVDHIIQSDARRGTELIRRELQIASRYLHLPIKNGATKRRVKLFIDDVYSREFEIELAEPGTGDFVTFFDMKAHRGKRLALEVTLPSGSKALDAISQNDQLPPVMNSEQTRPRYHFTTRRGWLNDPNGLFYANGEWHLYYQHNPYGWNWGNMHWGHAVSRDLLSWTELPTAIYPRGWDDWAFSGSAVVDARNSSGFKSGSDDVVVAAWTSTGRGECIAFSNDRGHTWTEFEENPVVKHHGRDPKIIWHAPSSRWVMAVYDEQPNIERGIAFYSSTNLKEWTFTSRIAGFYECPDLFPLAVDGNADKQTWVLYAADGKYVLGDFDGKTFTQNVDKQQVWYGNFYAAQTFDNAPDGRRVQIGWANGVTFAGRPFNQQMTVAVELTLRTGPNGVRMFAWPVKEVEEKSSKSGFATLLSIDRLSLQPDREAIITLNPLPHNQLDITAKIEPKQAEKVTLTLCGTPIVFDQKQLKLTCGRVSVPVDLKEGKLAVRVLSDNGSLEIFVNGGEIAMSVANSPSETDRTLKAIAVGGDAVIWHPDVGNLGATE